MVPQSPTRDEAARPFFSRLRRLPRDLFEAYFTVDPRSLGLTRIGLGALLLYDLARRVPGISTWYSNDGLLPNHTALSRPGADYMFSFLLAASHTWEAALMFASSAVVFVAFTLGYRTKLFHALSLACIVSLHSRAIFLENGGDVVLNLLCAWTLFFPMGARFSIDALCTSLRARRETSVDELNDRAAFPAGPARVASLAMFAILVQLAVIYYLNALHKTGWTWRQGVAVHYVMYQERMITWFGLLIRPSLQPWMTLRLTYTTWNIELLAPLILLNPFFRTWTRRVAIILLPALHIAFAAALNLGQFSFNMIGFYPLLIGPSDWELLGRWFGPAPERARIVHVNEQSQAFAWARVLARLDTFGRLRFAGLAEPDASFAVEHPTTHERATGTAAGAACIAALPCGAPIAALLRLAPLRWAIESLGIDRAARWSCFLLVERSARATARTRSPAGRWLAQRIAELREVAVVVLTIALGSQVLMENVGVPPRYKLGQTKWMQQVVQYPRLFQGWRMFSPDVPTGERMLYVDAITATGRHVDPYNEAGARVATLPVERIPLHMEQDEFWCDFTNRVPDSDIYWRALKAWIFDYPRRTGRPDDRIVSFEAKLLEQDNPPPGEKEPRNFRTKVMMWGRDQDERPNR